MKQTYTTTDSKQSISSAPVSTGGLTRLGYAFPSHVAGNKFFNESMAGFKRSGAESFTQLQCSMLDELIHGRSFQVTSPDVSCGSGKTSLTVAATIGLFQEKDKIIFVNKPGRGESSLTKELKQLVEKFSGGAAMMAVSTVLNDEDAAAFVPQSDVIITNCIALGSVLRAVVEDLAQQHTATPAKVYLIFDEAHKIFNHEGLAKMAAWSIEEDKKSGTGGASQSQSPSQPTLSYVSAALIQLHASSRQGTFKTIPIFLSAVGDFSTSKLKQKEGAEKPLSSSEVVEMCLAEWMQTPVTKLVNSGNNSERNYNNIFKIHREGALQIGGVDAYGYAMVYEAMFQIAFKRLIKGRMLFIVRRQQVETFSALLDAKIKESGSFFSYTTDRDYWNAIDKDTLQPCYNIVIVREDELDDLEGVNLDGLRAVYLFSLGRTQNLYQKMQGLGRVGRLGQEASYCFVMIDCATKKNGAIEAESSPFLLEALSSNGTCRPHIIEVKGAKALEVPSNIPIYTPNLEPPTPGQLQLIQKTIKTANRPQVCKFMRYSPKTRTYECPSIQKGYRCAWYHPRLGDFSPQSSSLKCCSLNTSYCKKGVFREAPCRCLHTLAPIAPLTASTMAWTAANPTPSSVLCSQFPKLGEEEKAAASSGSVNGSVNGSDSTVVYAPPPPEAVRRNPRLERPVCRFAAMDMYKCKTRREGKLCFFRHPEEAEDHVTDEEYLEALEGSLANLNKTKAKYGQQPIPFSRNLYSKYNYPGRFKSCLAKPAKPVKQVRVPVPEPVQSLESVLAEEKVAAESSLSAPSQLFTALQSAYAKKTISATASTAVATGSTMSSSDGDGFTGVGLKQSSSMTKSKSKSKSKSNSKSPMNYFQLLSSSEEEDKEEEAAAVRQKEEELRVADEHRAQELLQVSLELERVEQEKTAAAAAVAASAARAMEVIALREAAVALAVTVAAAEAVLHCGLLGSQVVDHLLDLSLGQTTAATSSPTTSAASLVSAFLAEQQPTTLHYVWFSEPHFGLGLKYLLQSPPAGVSQAAAQVSLLEAVEQYCHAQGFVKVQMKSGQKYLIEVLFRLLYAYELVEEEAFFAWHEQEPRGEGEEVKLKAVLQTTEFFSWLLQEQDQQGDEEEEDCSQHLQQQQQEQELSKADRKALKQLRRQGKVADRPDSGGRESQLSHRFSSSALSQ